jgi:hypothetical protein
MTKRPAASSASKARTRSKGSAAAKPAASAKPAAGAKRAGTRAAARQPADLATATKPREPQPATPHVAGAQTPATLWAAAAVQGLEAVGMCVATALAAAATINGKSYQTASGIALTLIAFVTALALVAIAVGLARAKPWSRTPSAIVQVFTIGLGIYVLDGHRLEWGVPMLILAAAGLAALLAPASLKALNRT